jgi:hypothetical protein
VFEGAEVLRGPIGGDGIADLAEMREEILAESAPHSSLPLLVSELERHLREIGRHPRGHDEALAGDADNRRSPRREKTDRGRG